MNKIIKIFYISALLFVYATSAMAQTILGGKATVSNLAVSHTDDKLFVSMDIDVSALKVKSNRELILTPMLAEGDDTLALSPVMIAGRNRYYHHLRNGVTPEDMDLYRCGDVKVIKYRNVIPYEKWMGGAALNVGGETCGCCSETLSEEEAMLTRLDFKPKAFVPALVYIRPKAERKINVIEGSAYIDFPVNRTEIYPDYRRNPVELGKIRATIDAVRNDRDSRITAVSIKGYASPEGPYDNNIRLAKGRTETLKEYVRQLYDFPNALLSTAYEPEDWAGLERFVENSDLKEKAGILGIIRGGLEPDAKDWKIKSTYPSDYAFLLKEVYPALRHSDYAVTYEVRAYTDMAEIRRLLKTQPQKLSLQEMYLVAQEMEPGSDEYIETFEISVRMFPDDEIANLNVANASMSKGDMKNAERYLARAGDTPQAIYARGVYYAISGDYEAAERLFKAAEQKGVMEATDALRQIEELK